jgi:hypothetical protein
MAKATSAPVSGGPIQDPPGTVPPGDEVTPIQAGPSPAPEKPAEEPAPLPPPTEPPPPPEAPQPPENETAPPAEGDHDPVSDAEQARITQHEHAKAMLEGPGGDVGMEIDVAAVNLDELPMCPAAVDHHGRLWAVDIEKRVLRLMGRVTR